MDGQIQGWRRSGAWRLADALRGARDMDWQAKIAAQMAAQKAAARKEAKAFADCIMQAIRTGNDYALLRIGTSDDLYRGWERVFRRIDRGSDDISNDIKAVFLQIWLEHKNWPLDIGKPALLARAHMGCFPSRGIYCSITSFPCCYGSEA
jgi:hypothetical protein